MDGAPVTVVENDDTAVMLGGVRTSAEGSDPKPVAAVLVASTAAPRTWLVASLESVRRIELARHPKRLLRALRQNRSCHR